jgi:hypothetical protein
VCEELRERYKRRSDAIKYKSDKTQAAPGREKIDDGERMERG